MPLSEVVFRDDLGCECLTGGSVPTHVRNQERLVWPEAIADRNAKVDSKKFKHEVVVQREHPDRFRHVNKFE